MSNSSRAENAKRKEAERNFILTADNVIKYSVLIVSLIFLALTAYALFGEEFGVFFKWYLVVFAGGVAFMPLSMLLMGRFRDSGWIVSKVMAIAVSGWLSWFLASIKLVKFTEASCWICLIICFLANLALYIFYERRHKEKIRLFTDTDKTVTAILLAEIIFFAVFIFWMYLKGFKPEAYGNTEKLMDFGFMQALYRSDYMPAEDIWLSGNPINYYYVGQFMATYITKLAGTTVGYGYNLMLMLIAAFSFSMPCSIVATAAEAFAEKFEAGKYELRRRIFPYLAGGAAGVTVSFAGNMHYPIFNDMVPVARTILGLDRLAEDAGVAFDNYWFPNATRYIGYFPETTDKTIHEFPLYSFVLGDLHAHVINIIFVLCVLAVLLGFILNKREAINNAKNSAQFYSGSGKSFWGLSLSEILDPSVIVIGFFIGLFHTTNFWDYPIYFVVSGAIILFINCILHNFSKATVKLTFLHAVIVLAVSTVVCLPFTLSFDQISNSVRLCDQHTPLFQLFILWGLPVIIVLVFLANLIKEQKEAAVFTDEGNSFAKKNGLFKFIANMDSSDLFMITLGLCAIGLVILPEIIYIKDIYSGDYKRANTMFKLTYQAFIMFGMVMAYVVTKFLLFKEKRTRVFALVTGIFLIWTTGYFENSTKAWFGDYSIANTFGEELSANEGFMGIMFLIMAIIILIGVFSYGYLLLTKKKSFVGLTVSSVGCLVVLCSSMIMWFVIFKPSDLYEGLDSGEFLKSENYADYKAAQWIEDNIEGRPVILEANGLSYTLYNRISGRTGLPTVLGWRTHEWLWRSDASGGVPKIIEEREEDVEKLFLSEDMGVTRGLIEKYNIEYIYIGDCEREKFEAMDYGKLLSLGQVIYPADFNSADVSSKTFIIKVNK